MVCVRRNGLTAANFRNIHPSGQQLPVLKFFADFINLGTYDCVTSHPLHLASEPGILCLDLHPVDQNRVVTGGIDSSVVIFNRQTKKVLVESIENPFLRELRATDGFVVLLLNRLNKL
jgi:hypothetical protein